MKHRATLPPSPSDNRNLIIALILTAIVIVGWKVLYENPRAARVEAARQAQALSEKTSAHHALTPTAPSATPAAAEVTPALTREEALANTPRIRIKTNTLHGSLSLKGARLDDLTLANYHETLEKNSPEVILLSPRLKGEGYFAEFGWAGKDVTLPNGDTVWEASNDTLTPDTPVTLHWVNPEGIRFEQEIALDTNYLFTVKSRIINPTPTPLILSPYSLINRTHNVEGQYNMILHEGALGVSGDTLHEHLYSDIREGKITDSATPSWAGITDKYWLTALIPDAASAQGTKTTYQHYTSDADLRYQVDMLAAPVTIAANGQAEHITRFFAGAKLVELLDAYATEYHIPMFDRSVDFGVLYFMTRPFFEALTFLHSLLGNFGLAIMALTILVKAVLYPLANKSYASMSQMKLMMPKMKEIRERFADDRVRMNQEIMSMYKEEGVNPASGCLPLLIQMPVFFALYKVLFITIEMRHATFYGWIQDLSAKDPTNLFTLFGMIPWDAPSLLHVGVLPIVMAVTMILQQQLNPKPTDPTQAQVMQFLPYMFLFVFASFPAGLVLYWAWNNTLSIMQQYVITRRYEKLYDKETGKRIKPLKNKAV
jgi:YidC/Oxa1 family membrane protein insertase